MSVLVLTPASGATPRPRADRPAARSVGSVRDGIVSGGVRRWEDVRGTAPAQGSFVHEQGPPPGSVQPPDGGRGKPVDGVDVPLPARASAQGTTGEPSATTAVLPPDPDPTMTVIRNFAGPADSSTGIPDPDIAAGTYDIVATVNTTMTVYNKSGVPLAGAQLHDWFAPLGTNDVSMFDPATHYDKIHNRFFIVVAGTFEKTGYPTHGYYYIAVSRSTQAKDAWCQYRIDTDYRPGGVFVPGWVDRPFFGTNGQGLYITGTVYPTVGSAVTNLVTVPMTKLLACDPLVSYGQALGLRNLDGSDAHSLVPATALDNWTVGEYMVNAQPAGSEFLTLWRVSCSGGCGAAPTITRENIWAEAPFYDVPDLNPTMAREQFAAGPNGATTTARSSISLLNAYSLSGYVYTTHYVRSSTASAVSAVRYYEISGATSTAEMCEIRNDSLYLYMPAIAVTPDRNLTVVYNYSSSVYAPGIQVHQRHPGGGCDGETVTYQSGSGTPPYMGDYSGASPDTDGVTTWVISQYGSPTYWTTRIAAVRYQ